MATEVSGAGEKDGSPTGDPDPSAGTVPMLDRPSLTEQFRRLGRRTAPGATAPRFEADGILGMGSTGRVYAMRDRNLKREVAVKFLGDGQGEPPQDEIDHFVAEAQITASLEHPNVLPVHEIGVNEAGQVYFTMKKIDGRSLGALIEQASAEGRPTALADVNALVNVVIGVCQALAYAHDRGVVHQDVKPENIMLGAYGEVLLVDWGSAARIRDEAKPRLYGTPLYMSPEQARSESVDERSDIYCVGATLFHALTLRAPTWSEDPDEFWRLKRAGRLQPPTPAERARVPAALLDIALKALAADPADRYASATALLDDLRHYQGGLAVSAHRDTWLETVARWHRRHWRAVWGAAASLIAVVALGAALYGEKIKEIATWGKPVLEERFADEGWSGRWHTVSGSFERRGGRLVSIGGDSSTILCAKRLWGPTAIEYEAEILPGSAPGDISLLWARDYKPDLTDQLPGRYRFQIGAYDGSYTAITTADDSHLGSSDFRPEPGRRYRIRVEIDDYRLSLAVDGRKLCEWTDTVRFDGGYVGLLATYPGKAFGPVRIYNRGVAQKVPATAIGDAFMRRQLYDEAFAQYQRIAETHSDTAVGREALHKEGLCLWEQGRRTDALSLWASLAGTEYEADVRLYAIDLRFANGDHDGALADLEQLVHGAGPELRKRIAMRWGRYADQLRRLNDRVAVTRYVEMHDRLLADEAVVSINAANALRFLGRHQEVIDRYPAQRLQCAASLLDLGRPHEVVERYQDQRAIFATACFGTGEWDRLEASGISFLPGHILVKRGHPEEALARYPHENIAPEMALLALGRIDELVARHPDINRPEDQTWLCRAWCLSDHPEKALVLSGEERAIAELALGDVDGALRDADPRDATVHLATAMLGLRAAIAGDDQRAAGLFASLRGVGPHRFEELLLYRLVIPYVESHADPAALLAAAAELEKDRWAFEQRGWYDARYLLGEIGDADYLAQPHRLHADARLLFIKGLRCEREMKRADALAAYRGYLGLPAWRRATEVEAVLPEFVRWRIAALWPR